ncbi:MAG TPA: hypothetical protein VFM18_21260 [Methanosarcina sp.]|nr:hypothetical protein [Methanosarcina sp.]
MALITPDYVRLYIRDQIEYNRLLDELEFKDERVAQAMDLVIDMYNIMTPITSYNANNFPNRFLLLMGTLYNLFLGEAAMAARNEMNYSDGGLQIPIEERFQYYSALADKYGALFTQMSQQNKIQENLEGGWGEVSSDFAYFPNNFMIMP